MTTLNYEKLTTRMAILMPVGYIYIYTFSRPFYPKRLTYVRLTMYTHFTFTLMAHCTSGAIRGSVSCSRTLRQGIELATFCLLNDYFTSCTTVALASSFLWMCENAHKRKHVLSSNVVCVHSKL